jgi:putative endonuclease
LSKKFKGGFTSRSDDWELVFAISNLEYKQARRIEAHIKKMKSRKYIEDFKRYPEMVNRLVEKYK